MEVCCRNCRHWQQNVDAPTWGICLRWPWADPPRSQDLSKCSAFEAKTPETNHPPPAAEWGKSLWGEAIWTRKE